MFDALLYRSTNKGSASAGPWTVIWQCRTREAVGDRGTSEEDYLRWLLASVDTEDVVDTDSEGQALFSHICDKAIIIYGRSNKNEKEFYKYLKKFNNKLCVIVHLSDEFCTNPIKSYKHASLVLRNYHRTGMPAHVHSFPLGCTRGKVAPSELRIAPPNERQYIWSFAGHVGPSKPHRAEPLEAFASLGPHFRHDTDSFNHSIREALGPREYCEILNDSVFVLCPRGNKSLDCFRNTEAAMYGAIPVVVGSRQELDRTFIEPFDAPFLYAGSWAEARRQVEAVMNDPEALIVMQKRILDWWAQWPSVVAGHLDRLGRDGRAVHVPATTAGDRSVRPS
jgi:hypothetical protein